MYPHTLSLSMDKFYMNLPAKTRKFSGGLYI